MRSRKGRLTRAPVVALGWLRLAAASAGAAASPFLEGNENRVRLALIAGLLWLPWAWLALLLAERPGDHRRHATTFLIDFAVLGMSVSLLPGERTWILAALAAMVLLHGLVLLLSAVGLGRKASLVLAATEQRLAMLFEQMPVVMWTTDDSLRMTSWLGVRHSWDRLLPINETDLSVRAYLIERDPGLLEAHERVLGGGAADCEIALGDRTYQAYLRPLHDDGNQIVGVAGAALDITDRKLAEDAKTTFLATASHELKTPLTVIKGFAETLANPTRTLDQPLQQEALKAIARRSSELATIVDRLLLSSRIESGRAEVAMEDFDVTLVVRERVQTMQGSTGRRIALTTDAWIPPVNADPTALATVVDHLIDNAIKYSPGGEPIRVTVISRDEDVLLEVADSGVGMTEEQVERCFEKFWQADGTDRRRFPGTGIGLYIVHSLVEAMGGIVSVSSSVGRGSCFAFTLRRADAPIDETIERDRLGVGDASVIREFMRQIGIPTGGGM